MMTYAVKGAVKMMWVVYVSEATPSNIGLLTEQRACKNVTFDGAAALLGLISSSTRILLLLYYYLY